MSDIIVGEKISSGGYGYVKKAIYHNKEYAIKFIKSSEYISPQELDILFRLNHPNLIHGESFFFSEVANKYGIMMNLAQYDLFDWLVKKNISIQVMIAIFIDIVDGLFFLHQMNFLHLDLKPENILIQIDNNGNPVALLSDFGLSLYASTTNNIDSDTNIIIETKKSLGTDWYLAPEHRNGSYIYTNKSDSWSLGVLATYLFSNGTYIPTQDLSNINLYLNDDNRTETLYNSLPKLAQYDNDIIRNKIFDILYHILDPNPITRYSVGDIVKKCDFIQIREGSYIIPNINPFSNKTLGVYIGLSVILSIMYNYNHSIQILFLAIDFYVRFMSLSLRDSNSAKNNFIILAAIACRISSIYFLENISRQYMLNYFNPPIRYEDYTKSETEFLVALDGLIYQRNLYLASQTEDELYYNFKRIINMDNYPYSENQGTIYNNFELSKLKVKNLVSYYPELQNFFNKFSNYSTSDQIDELAIILYHMKI